jgi:predicted amidophosphoribosyltransferase
MAYHKKTGEEWKHFGRFCPRCQKPIPHYYRVCPSCGLYIKNVAGRPVALPEAYQKRRLAESMARRQAQLRLSITPRNL